MATRISRAATATNKRGGKSKRRNRAARLLNPRKKLDSERNQRAFRSGRHETMARAHNVTSGVETEPLAAGVIEGQGYTPKRRRSLNRQPDHVSDSLRLRADAFGRRGEIPETYTARGENRSPALQWGKLPAAAEELVLVCDGGDGYVHWLVYRIPASVDSFPKGIPAGDEIADVSGVPLQGLNSAGQLGYSGPNPPRFDDWHHYRFRLYALDVPIRNLRPGMTWREVQRRIRDHVLDIAEMTGRYRR
jgi:Raf kinase inhibitor-like YbhB/YbcL family protein